MIARQLKSSLPVTAPQSSIAEAIGLFSSNPPEYNDLRAPSLTKETNRLEVTRPSIYSDRKQTRDRGSQQGENVVRVTFGAFVGS